MSNVRELHPRKGLSEQVRVMVACGASPTLIAEELSIPLDILELHYEKDLARGAEEANARVAKVFFDMATSGEFPNMTMAWMKIRAGWTETDPTYEAPDLLSAREKLAQLLEAKANTTAP